MSENPERALSFAQKASRGLPGSIKDVADFLLAEGTGITKLTMAEIAARVYVSKPTLVRFAKQAGYAGWTDFRYDFLVAMEHVEEERVRQAQVDINCPFVKDAPPQEITRSIARIHSLAAQEVERSIKPEELEGAAEIIVNSQRVALLSTMQNRDRGKVFASNLELMGILCRIPHASEAVTMINCLGEGDAVVAVSYSGSLRHDPMHCIPWLKKGGVRIVAITSSQESPLAELADHTLSFPRLERHHAKIASFYSGACVSLMLDILYSSCIACAYEVGTSRQGSVLASMADRIPEEFDR